MHRFFLAIKSWCDLRVVMAASPQYWSDKGVCFCRPGLFGEFASKCGGGVFTCIDPATWQHPADPTGRRIVELDQGDPVRRVDQQSANGLAKVRLGHPKNLTERDRPAPIDPFDGLRGLAHSKLGEVVGEVRWASTSALFGLARFTLVERLAEVVVGELGEAGVELGGDHCGGQCREAAGVCGERGGCFGTSGDNIKVSPHVTLKDGPGQTIALAIPVGPIAVTATSRIVEVFDEPDRFGFAYLALGHHPEQSEESFIVHCRADGEHLLEVTAVWSTGGVASDLLPPLTRFLQRRAINKYLDGIVRHRG